MIRRRSLGLLLAAAAACASDPTAPSTTPPVTTPPVTPNPPATVDTAPTPPREFRGAWIATVANIDWPSRTGLTASQQQTELRTLLRNFSAMGLNAAILHVRPAADALYDSPYEPWSRYLTGTQGQAPGYDPLSFAVLEAHAAGLELHAWVNPFRAGNASDTTRFAATHVWNARRDLARRYGTQIWMDPGDPEVQDRTMQVILDVVRRYDIDAVHLDDYFYPYLERDAQNRIIDFPDSATFAQYNPRNLARADWRRDNIDRFVERLYREVHLVKPWVRVGISPFGIWRPGNPSGITGLDAFTEIYANSKLWLNNGWVDYFAPQLYWKIGGAQDYSALLNWWGQQNTKARHLWPGNATYRVNDGTSSAFALSEIANQVGVTRATTGALAATGNIFYNTTSLFARSSEVSRALATGAYAAGAAVPPATPWLDATAPGSPAVTVANGAITITPAAGEAARWWVVQTKIAGQWTGPTLIPASQISVTPPVGRLDAVAVRSADPVWNLSEPAYWRPASILLHERGGTTSLRGR